MTTCATCRHWSMYGHPNYGKCDYKLPRWLLARIGGDELRTSSPSISVPEERQDCACHEPREPDKR